MDDEMERNWKDAVFLILRYCPGILLEGLRITTKDFSHDIRSPDRDLNPKPPEYEAGVLATRPRRSMS
jgi:hypothetical protein